MGIFQNKIILWKLFLRVDQFSSFKPQYTHFLTQLGVKSFFKIFFEGCQGKQLYVTNRKRNDLFNCINYFNSLLISIIRKKIGHPKVFHGYVAAMRWQKERFKLRPLVDIFKR